MKRVLISLVMVVVSTVICSAQPRVACVYSNWLKYTYKDDQTQILGSLGWREDRYENTQIKELVGKLRNYDMVIMNCVYNYTNTQDLSLYGKEFQAYLKQGGCLVVTDANYSTQAQWLTAVDPKLVWNPSNKKTDAEGQLISWANTGHPLIANESNPLSAWSYPDRTSPYLTTLYKNANGSPAVGVMEIGDGAVVVATLYRATGWPTAGFLQNLAKWVKDPTRLAQARERNGLVQERIADVHRLAVPMLSVTPTIDGKIGAGEWEGAVRVPAFRDSYGRDEAPPSTQCRIARTREDLVVLFECSDPSIAKLAKGVTNRDGRTWDNDSVEVFLDPTGTRQSYYQFAVGCFGAQYDAMEWNGNWDGYWEAKTSIGDQGWIAELRIPLAVLGKDAITSTGAWAVNFNRFARPGSGREVRGWSPTFANGILTGMPVRSAKDPVPTDLKVTTPGQWYMGTNNLEVILSNDANASSNAILQLMDLATGSVLWSTRIPATGKPPIQIKCSVNLDTTGAREMQFVLSDTPDRHRVLASSTVFRPEAAPAFTLSVAFPVVRGTIQSKDPIKKLVVDGTVGYDSADKLEVESRGVDLTGKVVSSTRCRVYSRKAFRMAVDLGALPVGKYQFTFRLLRNEQEIASQTVPMAVAPPAATEVSFDDKRICHVNGKPFFPIGLYHVSPAAIKLINEKSRSRGLPELDLFTVIKQVKDLGFNTIHHSWGMPDAKYLDYTQSLGMWVVPEVAAPTQEQVALANRYKNVLMWYGSDEPAGETLNVIKRARIQTAQLDPNRPVSAAVNNPELYKVALGGFDFVMMDPYVIRTAPLAGIADCVTKGLEAGNGAKPVWLVPQAFGCLGWNEPTPEEIKCEAYIGLVHGATGLFWYAFWTPENWVDSPVGRGYWVLSDTKLWDAFRKLNAEVGTLAPVVLTGQNLGPVKCTSADVHTCLWTYQGKSYLLAVNTLYTPVTCTLSGLGKTAEVMFENKTIMTKDGRWEESFKPLAVHVYVF